MRKSNYEHYSLTKKQTTRQTFQIGQFLGVNYNKNSLAIKDSQATEMKNLIFRDGVIQKRQGYENVASIKEKESAVLNGVYEFIGDDGKNHLIFHINTALYEVKGLGKGSKYSEVSFTRLGSPFVIANTKSFAIPSNHKLYILDGVKYRALSCNSSGVFSLVEIEDDEHTFIPTTTIGITEQSSGLATRVGLDDVNMLTAMRRNKLVTGVAKEGVEHASGTPYTYELDAPICDSRKTLSAVLSEIEIIVYTYPPAEQNNGGEE